MYACCACSCSCHSARTRWLVTCACDKMQRVCQFGGSATFSTLATNNTRANARGSAIVFDYTCRRSMNREEKQDEQCAANSTRARRGELRESEGVQGPRVCVWVAARESVHVCRMYNSTCICTIHTYIRSVFFAVTACNAVIIDAVWPSTLPLVVLVFVAADVALFCRLIHSRDFLPNTLTKRREQTVPAQCHKGNKMCIIIACEL